MDKIMNLKKNLKINFKSAQVSFEYFILFALLTLIAITGLQFLPRMRDQIARGLSYEATTRIQGHAHFKKGFDWGTVRDTNK